MFEPHAGATLGRLCFRFWLRQTSRERHNALELETLQHGLICRFELVEF